jgi:hypothetical protein
MSSSTEPSQLAAIVAEARAQVARRHPPDREALLRRIRDVATDPREADSAIAVVDRILAVHRAYERIAEEPKPPAPAATAPPEPKRPRRFEGFRARPTITGTLELRREETASGILLRWDSAPAVRSWEVRVSTRPDARGDWEVRSILSLAADTTEVAVDLDDVPMRVNVIGQARDGRPLRRALVSGLTWANRSEKWERRASAS